MKIGRFIIKTKVLCGKVSLVLILLSISILASGSEEHSYKPKDGFVPDQPTAIRVAEAVLIPIYGEKKIKMERPFKAILKNETWTVKGSLPQGMVGGVAMVELSKKDAKIIRVSHGQ